MKIGILTYHRSHNYGAFLQSQALCCRLNQEPDIDAEIIDFRMAVEKRNYALFHKVRGWVKHPTQIRFDISQASVFRNTCNNAVGKLSEKKCTSNDISGFVSFVKGKYDIIIAGSDEIWKLDGFRGFPNPYWLPGDLECRKFAYAASSRSDFESLSEDKKRLLEGYLNDFEFIGVRDQITYDEVVKHVERKELVHKCCDPSLLYDFDLEDTEKVRRIFEESKGPNGKKIIVLMTADRNLGTAIQKRFGHQFGLVSVFHWHRGYCNLGNLSPYEWMCVLKNADFVVTTYFHATCFSILFNTPFVAIGAKNKSEKISELLSIPELKKRYIPSVNDLCTRISEDDLRVLMEKDDYASFILKNRDEFKTFLDALRDQ